MLEEKGQDVLVSELLWWPWGLAVMRWSEAAVFP